MRKRVCADGNLAIRAADDRIEVNRCCIGRNADELRFAIHGLERVAAFVFVDGYERRLLDRFHSHHFAQPVLRFEQFCCQLFLHLSLGRCKRCLLIHLSINHIVELVVAGVPKKRVHPFLKVGIFGTLRNDQIDPFPIIGIGVVAVESEPESRRVEAQRRRIGIREFNRFERFASVEHAGPDAPTVTILCATGDFHCLQACAIRKRPGRRIEIIGLACERGDLRATAECVGCDGDEFVAFRTEVNIAAKGGIRESDAVDIRQVGQLAPVEGEIVRHSLEGPDEDFRRRGWKLHLPRQRRRTCESEPGILAIATIQDVAIVSLGNNGVVGNVRFRREVLEVVDVSVRPIGTKRSVQIAIAAR